MQWGMCAVSGRCSIYVTTLNLNKLFKKLISKIIPFGFKFIVFSYIVISVLDSLSAICDSPPERFLNSGNSLKSFKFSEPTWLY